MSEEKKGFLSRELTRRQFMKLSAKGLTGVALSNSLLALIGATRSQAEAGQVDVIATPDHLIAVNRAKCTGCQRCEGSCTLVWDGNIRPYMARLHVRENKNFGEEGPTDDYAYGGGIYGQWGMGPDTCKQCGDAPCMAACPVGAISVSERGGARVIDADTCVGCGVCAVACPWHMPRIDPDKHIATKCVNCGICTRNCPTSAIVMVPWEDVLAAM